MATSSNERRDPGVYLTRSQLVELFDEFVLPIAEIDNFIHAAMKYKDKNKSRYRIEVKSKQLKKKIDDAIDRSGHDRLLANVYSKICLEHRIKKLLTRRSSEWKNFTIIASKFHELFNVYSLEYTEEQRGGIYEQWMRFLLKDNPRRRFKSMRNCYNELQEFWDAKLIVAEDNKNKETEQLINLYLKLVYKNNPGADLKAYRRSDVFQHFVLARMMANKHKAPVDKWLEAQIEGLSWTGNLPEPMQLCTPNALDRYRKIMLKGFDHSNFRGFTHSKMLDKIIKRRENEQS
jgi:hypothetical protein